MSHDIAGDVVMSLATSPNLVFISHDIAMLAARLLFFAQYHKSMNYDALIASIIVSKDDQFITEINPEKRLYHSSESPMTEAGINGRLDRDLYVSLGNMVSENKWSIRVYDKPLIRLIWIGTIFMILGAIISIRFRRSRHYE